MTTAVDSAMALPCACLVGPACGVELWGLTSGERLRRQLRAVGVTKWCEPSSLPGGKTVLLLRADYLFEDRTIADLVGRPGFLLTLAGGRSGAVAVAAHVAASDVAAARTQIENGLVDADGLPFEVGTPADLSAAYVGTLLKATEPVVLPIRPEGAADLERRLFEGSYKGVTDLVTKWVWPRPARWVTGICARRGIRPNTVTLASLALVIFAFLAFANGWYSFGLVAAWTMTFLDTVDGKLARVTVDSSPFGHIFDHGIDLVSPPFWYLAWGWGLPPDALPRLGVSLHTAMVVIVVGYVVGRLCEGVFDSLLNKFSIFTWRPVDSYFRLIMARRNPNLVLLTASLLAGVPARGLVAVAGWTALSAIFLSVRFCMSLRARAKGPLSPWLSAVGNGADDVPLVARPFAPVAPNRAS